MIDYELMYIVSASFTDEELSAIEAEVGEMLTKVEATVTKTERLGKFRLAYPIKRQTHGHYILVHFQAEPTALAELNNLLRLSPDKVLRHQTLRMDEVGDEKYQLVQFQEVNVEDRPRRGSRTARPSTDAKKDTSDSNEDSKAQKEGVAALEESDDTSDDDANDPQDDASGNDEDLDKKIDEALEEKA